MTTSERIIAAVVIRNSTDPVIVIVGVASGLFAVLMIAVGVYSLVRGRISARDHAAWKNAREFGWFAETMGFALLLISITAIAGGLGWSGPGWALAVAGLILAAAAFYRIIRLVRRR